jgi:hypothetical protein
MFRKSWKSGTTVTGETSSGSGIHPYYAGSSHINKHLKSLDFNKHVQSTDTISNQAQTTRIHIKDM